MYISNLSIYLSTYLSIYLSIFLSYLISYPILSYLYSMCVYIQSMTTKQYPAMVPGAIHCIRRRSSRGRLRSGMPGSHSWRTRWETWLGPSSAPYQRLLMVNDGDLTPSPPFLDLLAIASQLRISFGPRRTYIFSNKCCWSERNIGSTYHWTN